MTIYALSSGPGLSGIAVIRISGSDTKKVLQNMTFLDLPKPKIATLRKFKLLVNIFNLRTLPICKYYGSQNSSQRPHI